MRVRSPLLTSAVVALLLAGCSSGEGAPAAEAPTVTATQTVEVEAPPTPILAYPSIEELREAAMAAGMDCEDWEQSDQVGGATASGFCGDNGVLAVFGDRATFTEQIGEVAAFLAQSGADTDVSVNLLIGQGWFINDQDLETLQQSLGGVIIGSEGSRS